MQSNEEDIVDFFTKKIRTIPVKNFNLQLAKNNNLTPSLLLYYSLSNDFLVSFRSAWLLEHIVLKKPSIIPTIYDQFIDTLEDQKNWSAIRSLTKIAMLPVVESIRFYIVKHK